MVTFVAQAVPRMGISPVMPTDVLAPWMQLAADPDSFKERLRVCLACPAKAVLLRVAHGGTVPDTGDESLDTWLRALSASSRFLRWLAVSQLPEVHAWTIKRGRDWPENSTFAYWWHTIEDRVLAQVEDLVTSGGERQHVHLSLHFDGIMVHGEEFGPSSDFKSRAEDKILREAGLAVDLVYKHHLSFLAGVWSRGTVQIGAVELSELDGVFWAAPGRALPFHLAVATGTWEVVYQECLKWVPSAATPVSWRHWDGVLGRGSTDSARGALLPNHGLVVPVDRHAFLVHCQDTNGQASSAAVLPTPTGDWQVVQGDAASVITPSVLVSCFEKAVDWKSVVSFHVTKRPLGAQCLLDLQVQRPQ